MNEDKCLNQFMIRLACKHSTKIVILHLVCACSPHTNSETTCCNQDHHIWSILFFLCHLHRQELLNGLLIHIKWLDFSAAATWNYCCCYVLFSKLFRHIFCHVAWECVPNHQSMLHPGVYAGHVGSIPLSALHHSIPWIIPWPQHLMEYSTSWVPFSPWWQHISSCSTCQDDCKATFLCSSGSYPDFSTPFPIDSGWCRHAKLHRCLIHVDDEWVGKNCVSQRT